MSAVNRKILPGFSLTLGYTVFYLSILVLIPLAACFWKASSLSALSLGLRLANVMRQGCLLVDI